MDKAIVAVILIILGIALLFFLGLFVHRVYRLLLEHFFREYNKWRKDQISKGDFVLSAIVFNDDGRKGMKINHSLGHLFIPIGKEKNLHEIIEQIKKEAEIVSRDWGEVKKRLKLQDVSVPLD